MPVWKNITIENDVYMNFGCIILDCAEVTIGEHSLFGPNIGIYTINHAIDSEERIHGGCYAKPVHIGKITQSDKTDYMQRFQK